MYICCSFYFYLMYVVSLFIQNSHWCDNAWGHDCRSISKNDSKKSNFVLNHDTTHHRPYENKNISLEMISCLLIFRMHYDKMGTTKTVLSPKQINFRTIFIFKINHRIKNDKRHCSIFCLKLYFFFAKKIGSIPNLLITFHALDACSHQ